MKLLTCIQNQGARELLAWQYPGRQFAAYSQLVVEDGEAAILLLPDHPPRLFAPGRHTLRTSVLPLLDSLVRLPFGGHSPFTAQLWFISVRELLGIKWGTATPVQLMDSCYQMLLTLRGYGQFGIRVEDPLLFFDRLCRNMSNQPADGRWFTELFRGVITLQVKDAIAGYMARQGGLEGLGGSLMAVSREVQARLEPQFEAYGLRLLDFCLTDISPVPGDKSVEQLREALTRRAVRRLYNPQEDAP